MLLLVLMVLVIYLVFGIGYSTYRLKKDFKRTYWMLNYVNAKWAKTTIFWKWVGNAVMWLPKLIMEGLR